MSEERAVVVGGKEYAVRKLRLGQFIKIVAVMAGARAKAKAAGALDSDPMTMAAFLAGEHITSLAAVVLDSDTPEDRQRFEAITLEESSELAVALTEVNDFSSIFSRFGGIAGKFQALGDKMNQALPKE